MLLYSLLERSEPESAIGRNAQAQEGRGPGADEAM